MSKLASFPGGMMLGAGIMYFLDPIRGRRRRARIHEAIQRAERVERVQLERAVRDAKHRVQGLGERLKHPVSSEADDSIIVERVRSRLGRVVSHPRAIDIAVHDGRAIVRGHVLESEAAALIGAVERVPGVRSVIDRLERHMHAGTIDSLQGAPRALDKKGREHWPPAYQLGAAGAGTLLLAYGALVRRGLVGTLIGAGGTALALRGLVDRPVPALFGAGDRRRTVTVQKTITVHQPVHIVFDLWSRLDNFPQFMQHVREVDVEIGGRKTHWIVDGPAGTRVEFEAETIEFEPDRVIAWRTLPNQSVEHEGRVRFEEVAGGTRVHVQMMYRPPGGVVGHAIAHILGWDPKTRMNEDLARMKSLLEDGKTRAHSERVELADLH
jgi:uncharacterized membrane protein